MQNVARRKVKPLIPKEMGEIETGIQKRKEKFPC